MRRCWGVIQNMKRYWWNYFFRVWTKKRVKLQSPVPGKYDTLSRMNAGPRHMCNSWFIKFCKCVSLPFIFTFCRMRSNRFSKKLMLEWMNLFMILCSIKVKKMFYLWSHFMSKSSQKPGSRKIEVSFAPAGNSKMSIFRIRKWAWYIPTPFNTDS